MAERRVGLATTVVAVLTASNLRGVRESGFAFAILTYLWMSRKAGA